MIVSHNELITAVHKAFWGMRRSCGEADMIADMVASLEIAGLHGVHHFNKASTFLQLEDDRPAEIEAIGSDCLKVELHNASLACHMPALIAFAIEKMANTETLTLEINHCHNRWLAYSELAKLSDLGFACSAQWSNGSSPKRTLFVLNQDCDLPEIFLSDHIVEDEYQSMTLTISKRHFDIADLASDFSIHIDSSELKQAQQAAWNKGISVDEAEWAILVNTGKAILVENSARSIKGAGELV